jgi:hypothetical protein
MIMPAHGSFRPHLRIPQRYRRSGIGQEDADLAILAFAGGATILAFDADGFGALLEEASFVDDEDGLRVAKVLNDIGSQVVTDLVGIPVSNSEQALDIIRGGVADVFGDLPAILAFNWADECAKVVIRLLARFSTGKVLGDALMQGR